MSTKETEVRQRRSTKNIPPIGRNRVKLIKLIKLEQLFKLESDTTNTATTRKHSYIKHTKQTTNRYTNKETSYHIYNTK